MEEAQLHTNSLPAANFDYAPLMRALTVFCVFALFACGTLRDDLGRAETGYDAARYDESMVWLEAVEEDVYDLDGPDRARFYYLRGMAALRLERRNEALHYLSLAREEAVASDGAGLRDEWAETLGPTLEELMPRGATHQASDASEE
ncbi:MAG: hypothetical protein ACI9KE_003826 [Polyangiales bacterium]|jgi:hypothetical protein